MLGQLLHGYYKTRYRLNRLSHIFAVKPEEKVLDIGSGDSPFAPADVLCERFPWDDNERTARFKQDRPLVIGDIEALPFKDKAFDFIHCSHVLEHTFHPEKAIAELMRVGRRGYIEVPSSYYEKTLRSYAGHLWFIQEENGTLVFKPKPRGIVDQEQINVLEQQLLERDSLFSAFYYARLSSLFTIRLWWKDTIPFRLEGSLDSLENFTKGSADMSHGETKEERPAGLAYAVKRWVKNRSQRVKKVDLASLIACPRCKGSLARTGTAWHCEPCAVTYPESNYSPVLLKQPHVGP